MNGLVSGGFWTFEFWLKNADLGLKFLYYSKFKGREACRIFGVANAFWEWKNFWVWFKLFNRCLSFFKEDFLPSIIGLILNKFIFYDFFLSLSIKLSTLSYTSLFELSSNVISIIFYNYVILFNYKFYKYSLMLTLNYLLFGSLNFLEWITYYTSCIHKGFFMFCILGSWKYPKKFKCL